MNLGLSLSLSRPVQGVPQPPPGFAFVIHNGAYVTDASGRYVIVEIA